MWRHLDSASLILRATVRLAVAIAAVAVARPRVAPRADRCRRHFNVPHVQHATPASSAVANVVTTLASRPGNVDGGWYQCGDVPAYVTREHPYSGVVRRVLGNAERRERTAGQLRASVRRSRFPPGGVLTAQLYQLSNEADTTFAYQEADLLDDRGNVVVNLYKTVNNKAAWVRGTWNLGAYAGRTYWLYFGVHGDGYSKLATQQFVDDVRLTGSASPDGESADMEPPDQTPESDRSNIANSGDARARSFGSASESASPRSARRSRTRRSASLRARRREDPTTQRIQELIDEANSLLKALDEQRHSA